MVKKMGFRKNRGTSQSMLAVLSMPFWELLFPASLIVIARLWHYYCVIIYEHVYLHDIDVTAEFVVFPGIKF